MVLGKLVPVLAVLSLAALVGCGGSHPKLGAQPPIVPAGKVQGRMTISQWPLYIDPGKHGTIARFEAATGVAVKYVEEINDNVQFFGKIRPELANGSSGGRSMITVSDWLAAQMYQLGYLERLDYAQLPNVRSNLIPPLRHPSADPTRKFTVPWQSGMTGLIVRTDKAPGVTSLSALFDPKYKGKVTMLTEMRDSVPMTLKEMGIDPDRATEAQWLSAVAKISKAASAGQIRRFTGNDYIKDLTDGDTWIALGWSGDAVQLQKDNPHIRFIMPREGCMLWSTSMEIPIGSPNPQAAEAFMNYVYDPKVQAKIAEYVNYVTPVKGVRAILRKSDPQLAASKLIFPTESYTRNCTFEPVLGGTLGQRVTDAFQRAIGS
jgi:spermidine/putrescine transport system substrate-binding protein